jgi:hypothetical protein
MQSFMVNPGSQTITFDAIPNQIFGISPFATAAQSSSLLPVSFVSNTTAICKLAVDLVIPVGTGACSITASQGGNGAYGAATPVTKFFVISPATPSGTLTQAMGSPITVGSQPLAAVVGNFGGSGNRDLAVVNQNNADSTGSVTILLGDGMGGFSQASGSPITVGADPRFAAAGDFNGDGNQDLAVVN